MLISSANWNVWKWGVAAVVFSSAIVAILAVQQRRPAFDELAMWSSERTAGLSAVMGEAQPVMRTVSMAAVQQSDPLSGDPTPIIPSRACMRWEKNQR